MTSSPSERSNWTGRGADTSAQNTYASIKAALKDIIAQRNVEVFLQGSYANATNVRADSDVDIVVMTKQAFSGNFDELSTYTRLAWDSLPAATYHESDLRAEVNAALVAYYGSSRVHPRNKCIQVDKRDGYVDADVVSCIQYRWYPHSDPNLARDYIEGIQLFPLRGGSIINFPKAHIKNGQVKNGECLERYKATVRQVKRLRTRAVDEGLLAADAAPGYLLECMTFNVPANQFVADDSDRLLAVLAWLRVADKQGFLSCDRIHKLFRTDPGHFNASDAQQVIDALWEAY